MIDVTPMHRMIEHVLKNYMPHGMISRFSSYLDTGDLPVVEFKDSADYPELRVRPINATINLTASSTSTSCVYSWAVEVATEKITVDLLYRINHFVGRALVKGQDMLMRVPNVKSIKMTGTQEAITSDDQADRYRQWISVIAITAEFWARR